jgi:hypothetical protein
MDAPTTESLKPAGAVTWPRGPCRRPGFARGGRPFVSSMLASKDTRVRQTRACGLQRCPPSCPACMDHMPHPAKI